MVEKICMEKFQSWDEMEKFWRELLSRWTDGHVVVGFPSNEGLKKHYEENLYIVWLLGKKLTSVEYYQPGVFKWKRSVLFLSKDPHFRMAVENRFEEVVSRPEESSRSMYEMLYAIVDVDYLLSEEYSWVHTVECPIICLIDDQFTGEVSADYYLITNPSALYTLPPEQGVRVFPLFHHVFHVWEFDFLPHWEERSELLVYLDDASLPVDAQQQLERSGKLLGLPCRSGDVDFGEYRYVIYPVGGDLHPLYVPKRMLEAIRKGCVVLTNNGVALHYPSVYGGVDTIDEGEVLLGLLSSYDTARREYNDPYLRINTMLNLVRYYTYEGLLHYFAGERGFGDT